MADPDIATITCPQCGHAQKIAIPEDKCLPFYVCEQCKRTISVPKGSKNCCVICEYSDKYCPVAEQS